MRPGTSTGKDMDPVTARGLAGDKADQGSKGTDGAGEHLSELVNLVVAYAKQETITPLRSLTRFVAWGVAGALLLAVGGVLAALTIVRLLQGELGNHLRGNLSWVPYGVGLVVAAAGAALAATRISKGVR